MDKCKVNKIFYYEVNNKKFFNESEAEEYSLKLFLVEEINKLWRKSKIYDDHSVYIDKDNKTIITHIYNEPIYDNWNVGHYGCTEPTVIDRSVDYKYATIQDFYEDHTGQIKELFDIADSIDIEKLSAVCDKEAIEKMTFYKDMVEKLKNIVNNK